MDVNQTAETILKEFSGFQEVKTRRRRPRSRVTSVGGGLPIQMQNRVPLTANRTQASRGSAVAPPRAANEFNGKSGHGSSGQSLIGSVVRDPKSSSTSNNNVNKENVQHQAVVVAATTSPTQTYASITRSGKGKSVSSSDQHQISVPGVYSSSDPVLAPSISKISVVGDAISREVGRDRISAGPNHVKGKKVAEASDLSASENEKSTDLGQQVTFPNHLQVPEAFKSGLTFENIGTFNPSENSSNVTGCDNSTSPTPESSPGNDEAVNSSNQSAPLTEHGGHLDHANSSSYLIKKAPASEGISIIGDDSKIEQPKQEVLLTPESHPVLTVQSAQN